MAIAITNEESRAISYLRIMAMLSIVVCHFMQALDSHWAWVFNIGVQVFLLISGYLYGHKQVAGWWQWFRKRFIRIYLPYILFFVAVVPMYAINGMITLKRILVYLADLQGIMGGVKGLGHLWFLTAIALCYAITPILQWTARYSKCLIWCVIAITIVILIRFPEYGNRASWFILYSFGYYLASAPRWERILFGNGCAIVMVWLMMHFSWESIMTMSSCWSMAFHITGALLIFLIGIAFFSLMKADQPMALKVLDKYSFQIYIVHHIVIMPPFGMLHVTDYLAANILIALFYTTFFTWVLVTMEGRVKEFLLRTAKSLRI